MSLEAVPQRSEIPPPLRLRIAARPLVGLARLLARLPPRRLAAVLRQVRRGAAPATYAQAHAAREAVNAVSLTCAQRKGCLPRSIASALLCRLGGSWPTWAAGVRNRPPFGAHAWIEAEGRLVDEGCDPGYFSPLIVIGPAGDRVETEPTTSKEMAAS